MNVMDGPVVENVEHRLNRQEQWPITIHRQAESIFNGLQTIGMASAHPHNSELGSYFIYTVPTQTKNDKNYQ